MDWRSDRRIGVSFMVVGHTRCSVDGGFGTAKKKFRNSVSDTMEQLRSVIDDSAASNRAKLFSWEWRDWDTFLASRYHAIKELPNSITSLSARTIQER